MRTAEPAAVIRRWPAPELPARPYPVLLPYTHPALLAGRENELAELRLRLRRPIPILGLSAPSGTGKSSLLLGGLVPELRADASTPPVALLRHPQEAELVRRLLGDLVEGGPPPPEDEDWNGFVERLAEIEKLAGMPPILVLDQFEEVLRPGAVRTRAVLGPLMAASVRRRPGTSGPLCRWLLAYRQDFLGELAVWLRDVLADARATRAGVEVLPHDLGGQRFHSMTLLPLGTPSSGGDALDEARQVFEAAITKPLGIRSADGERHYPWSFAPGHAECLARTFAEARLEQPDAPLGPELQVTLGHLLEQAGDDDVIEVDDTSRWLDQALEDHLRRTLAAVFPSGERGAAVRRARALLALRELAAADHNEGLPVATLSRAVGEDGERVLTELSTPRTRLVVFRDAPEGMRCMLSHGRMEEVVVRMVEEEGRRGHLLVDAELLALRRFIALKTSHDPSREKQAMRLSRHHYRRIAANAEALLWDEERRAWWRACRKRRRADQLRNLALAMVATLVLVLVAWGASRWASLVRERRALAEQVVRGQPEAALRALDELATHRQAGPEELRRLLGERRVPLDVLEQGLGGLHGTERSKTVLRTVELLLPWVEEAVAGRDVPDWGTSPSRLIAVLVWALDYDSGREASSRAAARALRDRVLEPLRTLRPPPVIRDDDPDWVSIPAGTFLMGSPEGEGERIEHPQHEVAVSAFRILRHEVTSAEYRHLVPDHDTGPVAWLDWYEAYTYAAWLGGRLPTEAEWEYAARANCPYTYCTEDGHEAQLDEVAWTLRNASPDGLLDVMRLAPNPWGLYDMLGNSWEWTTDYYAPYPSGAELRVDPWGPTTGSHRVARGGGLDSAVDRSRIAYRLGADVNFAKGLRVVLPSHDAGKTTRRPRS